MSRLPPLVDSYGRVHTSLRVSVTDRCNIRCFYCMPASDVTFRPRDELLSFEEITRFVGAIAAMGVTKIRLTGGEPLVRHDLPVLVTMLTEISDVAQIALTTNGMLLDRFAEPLKRVGLHRLNISLDTLSEEKFRRITRRTGLDDVLRGIAAAKSAGFEQIRLNASAIRDLTEDEVIPLVEFAWRHELEMRFIEFMPLDADDCWTASRVLTGKEIRRMIESQWGELEPVGRPDPSQPAVDFAFDEGRGRVGFISPVSEPFCGDCNRLRLAAEGQVRNCLFSTAEWDARAILRNELSRRDMSLSVSDDPMGEALRALVRASVGAKKPGHGIDEPGFLKPHRAMFQIGG